MRSSSPGLSAAVCGLSRTFSSSHSGLSRAGGSQEATSSAGPAQLPAGHGAQQRRLVDDLAAGVFHPLVGMALRRSAIRSAAACSVTVVSSPGEPI